MKKSVCLYWFFIIFFGILLAVVLRVFFFSVYVIYTSSMEPAIFPGDKVIVNKLIPGPRIISNFFSLQKGEKVNIERFQGIRTVQRNDILIFNFPYSQWNHLEMDMNVFYTKRCMAVPRDTFYIENGIYKVKNVPDILGYVPYQQELSLKEKIDFQSTIWNCFPDDSVNYSWNIKNFGPLYIPKKGDNLLIDTINYMLYKNVIEYESNKQIHVQNGTILLDGDTVDNYTFQQNYYFVAGDYIFDSKDSRYWGLLPEDHIVGKVAIIWQCENRHADKRKWSRLKKL
jgi:signal peptidase I